MIFFNYLSASSFSYYYTSLRFRTLSADYLLHLFLSSWISLFFFSTTSLRSFLRFSFSAIRLSILRELDFYVSYRSSVFYSKASLVFFNCNSITYICENWDCFRLLILSMATCSPSSLSLCMTCRCVRSWSSSMLCSLEISMSNFYTSARCSLRMCSTISLGYDLLSMETTSRFSFNYWLVLVKSSLLFLRNSVRRLSKRACLTVVGTSSWGELKEKSDLCEVGLSRFLAPA